MNTPDSHDSPPKEGSRETGRSLSIPVAQFRTAFPHVSFLAVMIFFAMYARLLLAPLLIYIQNDLGIGTAQATSIFIPLSISYAGAMLVSGYFARAIFHRRTIALSAVTVGFGLGLLGVSNSLISLYAATTIIGAGAGLYPPSGVSSVTHFVHDDIRGRAIALHEVGPNLAFVLAPIAVSLGTSLGSWRIIAIGSGAIAALTGVVFDRRALSGRFAGEPPRLKIVGPLLRQPKFWVIVVLFSLAASSTLGVYSILPTFLVQSEGLSPGFTNTLLSVSRISGVVVVLIAGVLIDRIGVARTIGIVFLLTGSLTIGIGCSTGVPLLIAVFLQPVIITAFFPAAIGAMADLGPPLVRNVAVSLVIPVVNIVSNGVFPSLMGRLAETGTIRSGFIGLGVLMVAGIALLPLLRERQSTEV